MIVIHASVQGDEIRFGVVLQAHGLRVSVIKIDPYLNIDAGTFSPFEHGEVFVLDDGGEVDLDLGNYERFLNVKLNRDNNITTGKIYMDVITREREGHFLGRTVQVIPHITDAIQEWVERVACQPVDGSDIAPDICIIELGGTIGDIESMPFVEAFRQFQFRVRRDNFLSVHVSLLPEPYSTGEQKTKPTQHSVRELRGQGLYPEIIICRSRSVLLPTTKRKISNFCHVDIDQVISVHDVSNLYRVPLLMAEQRVFEFMFRRLNLLASNYNSSSLEYWRKLAQLQDSDRPPVRIALRLNTRRWRATVGSRRRLSIQKMLENCDGILVPGGFGERGIEGKVAACRWARQKKVPFLGICLGMQCAVIEFARNVLGLKDANSTEFSQDTSAPVVIEMPEHNTGKMGGTMRLGLRTTVFRKDLHSVVRQLYGNVPFIRERHRHRYEVNPSYVSLFEKQGMLFTGTDDQRMEIFELQHESPYYIGVQFHPEYLSSPLNPSPLFVGLILASINQLHTTLSSSTVQLPLKGLWNNCHSSNGSTEQCALQA
ncbi:CTP synthase [Trichinella spiralis]|uniref:CTP synthase n=1 Tax=Trichinella spiralis TaxID=6334 RepID=A0ABR3K6N4_TRISP